MSEDETRPDGCGVTFDELSDYLARNRTPRDPRIEDCPECLNALETLESVSELSRELLRQEAEGLGVPPRWMEDLLASVHLELRSGRNIRVHHDDNRVRLVVTEGAVRALVRHVGDAVQGVLVAGSTFEGDLDRAGAPLEVRMTVSIEWGTPIPPATKELRAAVSEAVARHTELDVTAVHIDVQNLHGEPEPR